MNTAGQRPKPVPLPDRLRRFAQARGIRLQAAKQGNIDAPSARRLFVEALVCQDGLRDLLRSGALPVDVAAACFAVASGTWGPLAVEYIVRTADEPARLLRGAARPLDAAAWGLDVEVASAASLLSSLERRTAAAPAIGQLRDAEDVARAVHVEFSDRGTALMRSADPLDLSWSPSARPACTAIELLPLCADDARLSERVVPLARWLAAQGGTAAPYLLVSRDAERLDGEVIRAVESSGVGLLVAPLFATTITLDAVRRLERARTSRR